MDTNVSVYQEILFTLGTLLSFQWEEKSHAICLAHRYSFHRSFFV